MEDLNMPRKNSTKKLDEVIDSKIRSDSYSRHAAATPVMNVAERRTKNYSAGMSQREHNRFVKRLKALREEAGLSLREVAERAGIDHSQLYRLEAGERSCTLETAINIVGALGVKLGILVDEAKAGSCA
jgi:ribosome-binding protein aMBF1 (putative translation factor)